MAINWGSVADWAAALGGWGSVGSVVVLAIRERKRRIEAEERSDQMLHFYRSQAASRAIDLVESCIEVVKDFVPGSDDFPGILPDAAAQQIGQAQSKLSDLRNSLNLDPLLGYAIKDAQEALGEAMAVLRPNKNTFDALRKLKSVIKKLDNFV